MKKLRNITIVLAIILSVVLLTGCGTAQKGETGKKKSIFNIKKTMTCYKEEIDEDGFKTTNNYVITYTSKKVTKVKSETVMEMDPEYIDWVYGLGNQIIVALDQLDGIDASYTKQDDNKIIMKLSAEYDKLNEEQIKEALGGLIEEDSFYTKKEVTIDDFTKEYLEGYTCK